jgi:tRNA-specific 2-thiouridylase
LPKISHLKKRVVIGISGGVDSSVAAFLLKQQGFDVMGLFMINWHNTKGILAGDCPWNDDLIFAELVARKLGIPLKTVDFSEAYRKRVVDYMFSEYERGRTPNPDVLCNREIKFDLFVQVARQFDANFVATGHYCRREITMVGDKLVNRLLQGLDGNKDQSYFLCQLSQAQLENVLFPVGGLVKQQVRDIARDQGLATSERKDSQGICFVGKVDLPEFLKQKLSAKSGNIVEIPPDLPFYHTYNHMHREFLKTGRGLEDLSARFQYSDHDGKIAGTHQGAHFFTIGQRKGLNIGGRKEPLFVIGTDTMNNNLFVGMGHGHPGLNRWGLFIPSEDIHWIREDQALGAGENRRLQIRIRYRQPLQQALLMMKKEGLHVIFEKKQRGITPGQFAAWYDHDELIGSGVIQ